MAEGDGQEVAWIEEVASEVRALHDAILTHSDGLPGVHDERLVAACARPFQTAFGELLYQTDVEQAAALFHGIISGHVFVDGNKRTAVVAACLFLRARVYLRDWPTSLQARFLGELAVETASTGLEPAQIARWFERILSTDP